MKLRKIITMSFLLTLALILPFFTGQIPVIGKMLLPMHIPILLCGLVCGWRYGLLLGFISPILRGALFGTPPMISIGIPMAFELSVYGMISGLIFKELKKNHGYRISSIYMSLIISMIAGRIVWGIARYVMSHLFDVPFSWHIFVTGAFVVAIPGIIIQLVLIPTLIISLKSEIFKFEEECV